MTIEPQPAPPEPIKITSEYLDYLIGILTGTVTPKAAAEFIPVLEIARAAQLGVAWAEAEAALPEGEAFSLDYDPSAGDEYRYAAILRSATDRVAAGSGATPAAALRALAAKLRTP
jgi:hypothetical protein